MCKCGSGSVSWYNAKSGEQMSNHDFVRRIFQGFELFDIRRNASANFQVDWVTIHLNLMYFTPKFYLNARFSSPRGLKFDHERQVSMRSSALCKSLCATLSHRTQKVLENVLIKICFSLHPHARLIFHLVLSDPRAMLLSQALFVLIFNAKCDTEIKEKHHNGSTVSAFVCVPSQTKRKKPTFWSFLSLR